MLLPSLLVVAALANNVLSNVLPQKVFSSERTLSRAESTLVKGLGSLSEETFTVLRHELFDGHRVRVKKTRFCDATVQYVPLPFAPGSSVH